MKKNITKTVSKKQALLFLLAFSAAASAGMVIHNRRAALTTGYRAGVAQERRILCVGDNFTFGIGSSKGETYPDQLGWLIKANHPEIRCEIVNGGTPGQNSTQLAAQVEALVRRQRSDLVIVMTGRYDRDNLTESDYYLFEPGITGWLRRLGAKFSSIGGPWRFLRRLIGPAAFRLPEAPAARPVNMSLDPAFLRAMDRARNWAVRGNIVRAVREYRKAAELYTADYRPYYEMGMLYETVNDTGTALTNYEEAYQRAPQIAPTNMRLWALYYRLDRPLEADRCLRQAAVVDYVIRQRYATVLKYGTPRYSDTHRFEALLRYNLAKVARAVSRHGAGLVVMNYPVDGPWPGPAIESFVRGRRLIYIDHAAEFARKTVAGSGARGYLIGNDRCTLDGHRLMAAKIYESLRSHRYLESGGAAMVTEITMPEHTEMETD